MKVKARCPASCGELLQGWIAGSEKLISYPINWYSEVTIETSELNQTFFQNTRHLKVWQAFYQTCSFLGIDKRNIPSVSLRVTSTIPIAKGMASSTADIAATCIATAHLFGYSLTSPLLAKICLLIEATDSTIFPSLTLFDHLQGNTIEETFWEPNFDVLILEPLEKLSTDKFRKVNHQVILKQQAKAMDQAYLLFKQAVAEKSIAKLGLVATISAKENQRILPKKRFQELLMIVEENDLLGINVAHSGTVIGLMYDRQKMNSQKLLSLLEEENILVDYPCHHFCQSTQGGATILS
ncbi:MULTISPECIES: GHMP family kinase ATP-binding protein [Bacillus]|uniref:GHMP family kinase ATP-binding protein n=1 Tax=Bacillus TaxID=1386 RepID=UPI0003064A98|nr:MULTISPECIES: hypothetical protein [Bacillus]